MSRSFSEASIFAIARSRATSLSRSMRVVSFTASTWMPFARGRFNTRERNRTDDRDAMRALYRVHGGGLKGTRPTHSLPSHNSDSSLVVSAIEPSPWRSHGARNRPFDMRLA